MYRVTIEKEGQETKILEGEDIVIAVGAATNEGVKIANSFHASVIFEQFVVSKLIRQISGIVPTESIPELINLVENLFNESEETNND